MVTDDPRTLKALIAVYLDWRRHEFPDSHARVADILTRVFAAFHDLPPDGLTPFLIERWKLARLTAVRRGTVLKELRTLSALYNAAISWGLASSNPVRQVRKPRDHDNPPRWYTAEELGRLYAASGHHAPWWRFLANTGLRRAEALHLRRANLRDGVIQVMSRDGARTKSRRARQIPLSPGARAALAALPDPGNGYVLPRINPDSMSRAFRVDARRAGLDGSLHALRHTFAAHLASRGVPLREIQLLLGHSTIRVTEMYAHLAPERLRAAVRNLDL